MDGLTHARATGHARARYAIIGFYIGACDLHIVLFAYTAQSDVDLPIGIVPIY